MEVHATVLCVSAQSQAASRKRFMVTYFPAGCLKTVPGGRVLLKWCCSKSIQSARLLAGNAASLDLERFQ